MSSLKINVIDKFISSIQVSKSQNEIPDISLGQKCVVQRFENFMHMEWSEEKFLKGIVDDKGRIRFRNNHQKIELLFSRRDKYIRPVQKERANFMDKRAFVQSPGFARIFPVQKERANFSDKSAFGKGQGDAKKRKKTFQALQQNERNAGVFLPFELFRLCKKMREKFSQ